MNIHSQSLDQIPRVRSRLRSVEILNETIFNGLNLLVRYLTKQELRTIRLLDGFELAPDPVITSWAIPMRL